MTVLRLNHVNIRTRDVAATVRFYAWILGLAYDGPEEVNGSVRNWLYDRNGHPIIHLLELAPAGDTTGALDHIALDCDDLPEVVSRLDRSGIDYTIREYHAYHLIQIFVNDPNGIALELNFPLAREVR